MWGPRPSSKSYVPLDDSKDDKASRKLFNRLGCWHWAAAAVHFAVFVALAVFQIWEYVAGRDGTVRGAVYSDVVNFATKEISYTKFGDGYDLLWVLLAVPLVTALVHCYQSWRCYEQRQSPYKMNVVRGINKTRWSEYSVTAALMTWILCQLCGITNLYVLLVVAILGNIVLQWHGYYFEEAAADATASRFDKAVPMLRGSLIFFFQWIVITASFARTVSAGDIDALPFYVWASFFGIFATYCGFPLVQLMFAGPSGIKNWYGYEMWFILLSLLSKVFLTVTLFAGAAMRE